MRRMRGRPGGTALPTGGTGARVQTYNTPFAGRTIGMRLCLSLWVSPTGLSTRDHRRVNRRAVEYSDVKSYRNLILHAGRSRQTRKARRVSNRKAFSAVSAEIYR